MLEAAPQQFEQMLAGIKPEPGQPVALLVFLQEALQSAVMEGIPFDELVTESRIFHKQPSIMRKLCCRVPVYEMVDEHAARHQGIPLVRYFQSVVAGVLLEETIVKMRAFGAVGHQQVVVRHYRFLGENRVRALLSEDTNSRNAGNCSPIS